MKTPRNPSVTFEFTESPNWLKPLGIVFVLYAVFFSIPWQPAGFSYGLDESFTFALNRAFSTTIQFGKDFVYTYGPYGMLQAPRSFPETYTDIVIGRAFVGLVMGIGLVRLYAYCWNNNKWSTLFFIPFLFFFPTLGMSTDSFFIILVTLPLLVYFYVNRGTLSSILLFLLIGAAFAGLIKQTFLILGGSFVLLITIDEVLRRRRFPVILTAFVVSVLGFWLLAGQTLANIFPFLKNGSEIVRGFSATMGLPGRLIEIFSYLISAGFFFALTVKATLNQRNRFDFLPVTGLALIFFLTFKGAFVRHDAHALQSGMTTIPMGCLFSALLWPTISQFSIGFKKRKTKVPIILVSWVCLWINASLIFEHYANQGYAQYFSQAIARINDTGKASYRLLSGKTDLREIYEESLKKIRKANPLPEVSGTTDLYPNDTAVIFAYDLPYQPRPVIQSFSAYTGKLAEMNAAHLRDSDAPETILFAVQTIDNRLPSSDDGLSWPEILTRYEITDLTGRFLVLKRRSLPLNYSFVPLMEQKAKMEEWIELPDSNRTAGIWMRLDARPNFLGRVATTLFKLPPLYLEVELADGRLRTYRVFADVMNAGQLLSPLVNVSDDFVFLASGMWKNSFPNMEVKKMRLVPKGWGSLAYPQSYALSLSHLEFPHQDFSLVPGWSNYEAFALFKGAKILRGEAANLQKRVGPNGKPVILAHADMRIGLRLPEGSQKLSFGYGILDEAWQGAKEKAFKADGVEFRVLAIFPDGREAVLFAQWLDPHANASDRGEKKGEIDLTGITLEEIALETLKGPKGDPSWDWSYWSELKVEPKEQ